jgi:hypothetical protein
MSGRLAAVAFITVALTSMPPALADAVLDGIAGMPGGVEDVRIGGTWQKDGKSGAYRVVIARTGGDAVTARLFVQWVAYGEAGDTTVENTIEIAEFAPLGLDIVDYVSESDADGLSVFLETIDPQGSADAQYELYIFAPDDYRFGPATN